MYLICDYKNVIVEICENPAWIKRQSNGVDVLCPESEATCLYSNDTDTYYPAGMAPVSGNRYHLETVEEVPEGVTPLHWKYSAGEFSAVEGEVDPSGPEMHLKKLDETAGQQASQTTDLQIALTDVFEAGLTQAESANSQITELQLAIVELYESMI